VDALINDVTSGALRKRQSGRDGVGKGLDIYDSDDEAEAMLRRIQAQMGISSKKKSEVEDGSLAALGKIRLFILIISCQSTNKGICELFYGSF
jgi:hypothetical protein